MKIRNPFKKKPKKVIRKRRKKRNVHRHDLKKKKTFIGELKDFDEKANDYRITNWICDVLECECGKTEVEVYCDDAISKEEKERIRIGSIERIKYIKRKQEQKKAIEDKKKK